MPQNYRNVSTARARGGIFRGCVSVARAINKQIRENLIQKSKYYLRDNHETFGASIIAVELSRSSPCQEVKDKSQQYLANRGVDYDSGKLALKAPN